MVRQQGKAGSRLREIRLTMDAISIYRNLLRDELLQSLYDLVSYSEAAGGELSNFINLYNNFFYKLAANRINSIGDYILEELLFDENPFSSRAEAGENLEAWLDQAVRTDLDSLQAISRISPYDIKAFALDTLCKSAYEARIIENLPEWNCEKTDVGYLNEVNSDISGILNLLYSSNRWSDCIHELTAFYSNNGAGVMARYSAFVWEYTGGNGCLKGIEKPDPVRLSELIGYESEREEVISNTTQFLKGYAANNVLLYGDRGTGKSSTVKAILNEYRTQGLRMIEVPKKHLADFPHIIRLLKGRYQKYIVFVDDLAFEDSEESYTALKAVLEGGLENRPRNVLVYATSNRRHLIKEKFSDRAGFQSSNPEDEVRAADTMQEKLSLSDRFGITVVFSSPDKNRYLEIVEGIAAKRGIKFDRQQLHKEALKWELWYNGRSPRTARQFIDWLEGQAANIE